MATALPLFAGGQGIVDAARHRVITEILATGVTQDSWKTWGPRFRKHLGSNPSTDSILSLGSELSDIFLSTRGAGARGQSEVSGAGAAWEGLICYYLNLCLVGTSTVVFRRRSQVPEAVRDALTVMYRTVPANTESDMVAVTFPADDPYLALPLAAKEKVADRLDFIADKRFDHLCITVVQCKTNWNENAQIPMLWDMVYNTDSFEDDRIKVGVNNRDHKKFAGFSYSFVTVPTNKVELYKPTSLSVRRVHELSGGNYWGRPTKRGVAKSLQEIFVGAKMGPSGGKDIRRTLSAVLPRLCSDYGYFDL